MDQLAVFAVANFGAATVSAPPLDYTLLRVLFNVNTHQAVTLPFDPHDFSPIRPRDRI